MLTFGLFFIFGPTDFEEIVITFFSSLSTSLMNLPTQLGGDGGPAALHFSVPSFPNTSSTHSSSILSVCVNVKFWRAEKEPGQQSSINKAFDGTRNME